MIQYLQYTSILDKGFTLETELNCERFLIAAGAHKLSLEREREKSSDTRSLFDTTKKLDVGLA